MSDLSDEEILRQMKNKNVKNTEKFSGRPSEFKVSGPKEDENPADREDKDENTGQHDSTH